MTAAGQGLAAKLNHPAIGEAHLQRTIHSAADQLHLLAKILFRALVRHGVSSHAAPVAHELTEGQIAGDHVVRHAPKIAKDAIHEAHVAVFIEDDNTDVQHVNDFAQRGQFLGHLGDFNAEAGVAAAGRGTRACRKSARCNAHVLARVRNKKTGSPRRSRCLRRFIRAQFHQSIFAGGTICNVVTGNRFTARSPWHSGATVVHLKAASSCDGPACRKSDWFRRR